jgi:hypothetical protein
MAWTCLKASRPLSATAAVPRTGEKLTTSAAPPRDGKQYYELAHLSLLCGTQTEEVTTSVPLTMWRLRPRVLAGALWAALAAQVVRRRLKQDGVGARVPAPPRLGPGANRGVMGALSRLKPTCLERALVLQAWLASQGTCRDVVIGVPPDGMQSAPAHAWVDGTDAVSPAKYLELHRLRPPTQTN